MGLGELIRRDHARRKRCITKRADKAQPCCAKLRLPPRAHEKRYIMARSGEARAKIAPHGTRADNKNLWSHHGVFRLYPVLRFNVNLLPSCRGGQAGRRVGAA
ncbi:hypothetical protein AA0616_1986 [Komagataeibacter nataicola NRIC 0616]|nr:hypothetical protein AA0616_1986 [Komagataeibacter nataicola NRIC 0616]